MRKIYNYPGRKWAPMMALLLLQLFSLTVSAQKLNVTGTVKDEKGISMPGVTVSVKGTSQGMSTDNNGKYSISVPENGTLVFKFVGYTIKEVAVKGRSVIDVSLSPESSNLNELIVTGVFDKRTAQNSSIAISSITAAQIEK